MSCTSFETTEVIKQKVTTDFIKNKKKVQAPGRGDVGPVGELQGVPYRMGLFVLIHRLLPGAF